MNKNITINNIDVGYKKINSDDFISLTDMAKFRNPDHTGLVIANWLRTNYTIEFMGIWEKTNNPDFNVVEFEYIRNESGSQSFTISCYAMGGTDKSDWYSFKCGQIRRNLRS